MRKKIKKAGSSFKAKVDAKKEKLKAAKLKEAKKKEKVKLNKLKLKEKAEKIAIRQAKANAKLEKENKPKRREKNIEAVSLSQNERIFDYEDGDAVTFVGDYVREKYVA